MSSFLHDIYRSMRELAWLVWDLIYTAAWVSIVCLAMLYSEHAQAAFSVRSTTVKESLKQGAPQNASIAIESNAEMSNCNVQLQILDRTRRVVAKHEFKNSRFKAGIAQSFSAKFSTVKMKSGPYTIAVEIFGPDKTASFHFEDNLASFDVIDDEPRILKQAAAHDGQGIEGEGD